jgi:hypothetical protein
VSVYLLIALPVLLLAVGVAIYSAQLVDARTRLQNAADAAALAAVQVLVDDDLLTGNPAVILALLDRAQLEAQEYARSNPDARQPLDLLLNRDNDPNGDIVFGSLDEPRSGNFVVANLGESRGEFLSLVNAVRVTARRTRDRGNALRLNDGPLLSRTPNEFILSATATLDRDVIGFRPVLNKPLPLAPLALLSDVSGAAKESWEHQVERRGGGDEWRFDRVRKAAVADERGDGLFEMQVRLAEGGAGGPGSAEPGAEAAAGGPAEAARPNACLLELGVDGFRGLAQQLLLGVSREQLQKFGGEFVLGKDNSLVVPGSPRGPSSAGSEFALLRRSLEQVRQLGEPRVWPLFSRFDDDTDLPVVTGFVAARVVFVSDPGEGQGLNFVLQPCMISSVTAVTDAAQRGVGGVPLVNPYICRVRLVE